MPNRAKWIFAAIVLNAMGTYIYQKRCWIPPAKMDAHIVSGGEHCIKIDVEPYSVQKKRLGKRYRSYDFLKAKFQPDSGGDSGLLVLGARASLELKPPYVGPFEESLPDVFRIRFGPPATVEALPPEQFPGLTPPTGYLPKGGELVGWREFRTVRHWHPLSWFHSTFGEHGVFPDGDHNYESSGRGYGMEFAVYSPAKDFILLAVSDNDQDCSAYLEVFRRRDHRLVAKIRVDTCSFDMAFVLASLGWVSDRDFMFVTGFSFSDCVICRFDK